MTDGLAVLFVISAISVIVWALLLYEHHKHGPR